MIKCRIMAKNKKKNQRRKKHERISYGTLRLLEMHRWALEIEINYW